jgi:hypothetical protein
MPLAEAGLEQVREAGFIVRKLAEELRDGERLCHAHPHSRSCYVCKWDNCDKLRNRHKNVTAVAIIQQSTVLTRQVNL